MVQCLTKCRGEQPVSNSLHALPPGEWPGELGFVPFVGRRYEEGVGGVRVLLLGESHYRVEGADNTAEITRDFTRTTFADRIEPQRNAGAGRFFPPLDRLLTGNAEPSASEAAAAWERIAFTNLVQEFAGTRAGDRPDESQFKDGSRRIMHALRLLRPDIVLVLGRRTWTGFDAGARCVEMPGFSAERVRDKHHREREVWRLSYPGGDALMSWVYHPSRAIDDWRDMNAVLNHLLSLARRELQPA